MFLILWLLLGVAIITLLSYSDFRLVDIKSAYLRRPAILLLTLSVYPAYVAMSAMDFFLQAIDVDLVGRSKAYYIKAFFKDVTSGFYSEAKGAW